MAYSASLPQITADFFRHWIVPVLARRPSTSVTLQTLGPTCRHLHVLQQVLANPIRSAPVFFALTGVNPSPIDRAFDPISIGRAVADMIERTQQGAQLLLGILGRNAASGDPLC